MIDKIKIFLIVLLIIMLILGLFYSIYKLIANSSKEEILITSINIKSVKKDENLVTNYGTYYYLGDCLENFVESCRQGKYEELYNLYIDKYLKYTTKNDIIEKLKSLNFNRSKDDGATGYKLGNIYKSDEDEYILEIKLNDSYLNLIMQKSSSKVHDYYFAFVI